jgi:beta-glucosidase
VNYAEDVFVGYRHYDLKNKDVTFPFGYGLSYTTFAFSNLVIRPGKKTLPVSVQVDIRNMGTTAGAEVVQLYVHDDHSKVERPPKELKGFEKVMLKPGQTKRVTFMLDKRSFAYYDVQRKDWNVDPGNFEIQVGNSSRDIKLTGTVEIK